MEWTRGNLLEATEDYILQQCNCLCIKGHGLSNTLAEKFLHARIYGKRRGVGSRNLAISEDRASPGTATICFPDTGTRAPAIICLFGQWRPGSTGVPYWNYYPESDPPESVNQRVKWFISGLYQIGAYFTYIGKKVSIAVPYRIGCGLAGGDWDTYKGILEQFQAAYKDVIRLRIYKLD